MTSAQQIAEERQRVNDTVRAFLRSRGSVEVETPVLVRSPDLSPNLTPFETTAVEPNGTTHRGALITSPEFSMKKLLGRGMEKIFTIAKVFRNKEEFSARGGSASGGGNSHNPEFTLLEWYCQGADYHACMDETEALVREVGIAFGKTFPLFRRVRVRDLFLEYADVDLDTADRNALESACRRLDIRMDASDTESDLFYRLFLTCVEPNLVTPPPLPLKRGGNAFVSRRASPPFQGGVRGGSAEAGLEGVFVYDYPKYQAALSQLTPDGRYGQRFELYIGGLELCNGFTELTDTVEQRQRFEEEIKERAAAGKTPFPIDEELLRLLPSIRKPTFGNALGMDRLHMVVTGRRTINDVLLFPASDLFRTET